MKNTPFSNDCHAVSEVIGAIILVLIAVGAFAAIYSQVFPVKLPGPEPHVQLAGYVTNTGKVVLEHVGGVPLYTYKFRIEHKNGTVTMSSIINQPIQIGEHLPINETLNQTNNEIKIIVWNIGKDGSEQVVFDGIITPKDHPPGSSPQPLPDPMSISTLRTDTVDEDLICYSYSIHPNIQPLTFIYNWMVASTGPYHSLTRLLMPFDTRNPFNTKDYSGNFFNGTISGATWTNQGKLGGAYQFDGDDFIAIPYCFETNKILNVTVGAWIKTSLSSGTILSYARDNYWELAVSNGRIKWSTNSSDGCVDVNGNRLVNDNQWHLVAVTYSSFTGDCGIYVDGVLDVYRHTHAAGKQLGSGNMPSGAIGKGTGVANRRTIFSTGFESQDEKNKWEEQNMTNGQQTWTNLRYDNFNSGWGNYQSGGSDCYRTNEYKYEGTNAVCIRDNNGISSSFNLANTIDVHTPEYTSIKLDFWWMWNGPHWLNGEDWWVQYYNGSSWVSILDTNYPSGYSTNVWYHKILFINNTNYNFPTNMNIRFRCDAGDAQWSGWPLWQWVYDNVYIDKIYINVTSYGRIEGDFNLLPSTILTPHSELYSIGGTGDFDPEYALFNRTDINISGYQNVKLSIWYSYKNTENNDFFGLYYKNNSQWEPIFEIINPTQSGQEPWTQVIVDIPKTLSKLRLQFKWRTTASNEYMAIDDLEITGVPYGGENNFTGCIDEVKIYPRVLSSEQLYQNYLCTKDGNSTKSVIVSEEICLGESWKCLVTPNDGMQDDVIAESNILNVINYGGGG